MVPIIDDCRRRTLVLLIAVLISICVQFFVVVYGTLCIADCLFWCSADIEFFEIWVALSLVLLQPLVLLFVAFSWVQRPLLVEWLSVCCSCTS